MNGIPFLDAIPVNWFILGTSVLAGVILFLILTQIPDDDEKEDKKTHSGTIIEDEEVTVAESKPAPKKKASKTAR